MPQLFWGKLLQVWFEDHWHIPTGWPCVLPLGVCVGGGRSPSTRQRSHFRPTRKLGLGEVHTYGTAPDSQRHHWHTDRLNKFLIEFRVFQASLKFFEDVLRHCLLEVEFLQFRQEAIRADESFELIPPRLRLAEHQGHRLEHCFHDRGWALQVLQILHILSAHGRGRPLNRVQALLQLCLQLLGLAVQTMHRLALGRGSRGHSCRGCHRGSGSSSSSRCRWCCC
mmetsp:Transcript_81192/g.169613  ORF Transcript_81192/g.169613 Transcript_81192/m.169613 type:complete len:224 (+) Transcript_81192:394-1065(+)